MSRRNLILISVGVFVFGLFIGILSPQIISQIMPQQTIYDKLNNAGIPYLVATDSDFTTHSTGVSYSGYMKSPAFEGILYFNQFKSNYFYQKSHPLNNSNSIDVFVDPKSKIIWIEEEGPNGLYTIPMDIPRMWFNTYTEPN
jgi:hypothetical protein